VRRYLQLDEVDAALRRGRTVESFVGACVRNGQNGFRWLRLRKQNDFLCVGIFETADQGSPSFLDIYELAPLDPTLALGEPAGQLTFGELPSCITALSERFPESPLRFVNEGVIQDEYADFISGTR
jgi:hypothetical protein